ncbi:HD domain-containing phosphohydrolase [Diaphorobacter sp. C33]|uniref:HD domain-containing protein n=1 Tax=Diaphorobacter nitroreducens TaxID=164759 RepID=A0AAX1WWG6_9BURK|nr:HD domain-containing phosphohydrolase [Diaphorobacter sp. C33]ROR48257.1 HD domain-containing protein [Diaphorobacter nitroreducens]WKK90678.1 HD domain-containing phosphohydrolase [Diaphorobacter sp. C33]
MNAPDLSPAAFADGDSHYLRAITDMADRRTVVTQEALYTDRGIKLVDKGARVDSRLYDRLVKHKLRGSIDEHLAMDDMVSVQSIVQLAASQCEHDTLAYLLVHTLEGMTAEKLLAPVRALLLPPSLAFKLTVMREQHPVLFEHSVRMMLAAVYLGIKSGWSDRECVPLATAALLHDIGVLHMDPVWHDPANKMTAVGRQQLMAHPITAMLIIRGQNMFPRVVEQAVLEHHECMDGSGYPRGLQGDQISLMGQILMVAEVVAAFFEKYANEAAAQRLSLTLRLNHRKFPAALIACLLPVLQIRAVQTDVQVTPADVERLIEQLSTAFGDWDTRRAGLPPEAAESEACAFVEQRLSALQKTLFEAGSHPQQQAEALQYLQGDEQGLAELALLGREALWQLQGIVDATHSRWLTLEHSPQAGDRAVVQWRDACAVRLAQR